MLDTGQNREVLSVVLRKLFSLSVLKSVGRVRLYIKIEGLCKLVKTTKWVFPFVKI